MTNNINLLSPAAPAPTRTRSNPFQNNNNNSNHYPPPPARIPRLIQRPLVHRDVHGNIITTTTTTTTDPYHNRPSSISSAISITREYVINHHARTNNINNLHQYNEKAIDIINTLKDEIDIQEADKPTSTNYVPLQFKIISQDGGSNNSNFSTCSVENILKNDGSVYCSSSEKCGGSTTAINILLKYKGHGCCSISHVIVKLLPQYDYNTTLPCKEGMIFMSHKPIDITSTKSFDLFTQENYSKYMELNQDHLDESDPVDWFNLSNQQGQSIINLKERSCKFILIKFLLLPSDLLISDNHIDIQFVGFIGYEGSRCFAKFNLC